MVKIFTQNEGYNGQTGPVQFVNGVAVTDNAEVIAWAEKDGSVIVEDVEGLTTFDVQPKETLVGLAEDMGLDPSGKTKKEILDLINAFIAAANA